MKQVQVLTWDKSSGDDDVDIQALLCKQLHLSINELLGHLFSVATLAFSRFLHVHPQWLGSQGLKLLQGCSSTGVCVCAKEKSNITRTSTTIRSNLSNNLLAKIVAGASFFFPV